MNILTFDVEEWFHILDNDSTKSEKEWSKFEHRLEANMDRIFELLERKNQKATFFVLGWVARKYPQVLKKIDDMGFEIATHSDKHQLVYEQSRDEFKNDLERSIKSLEDVIGKKVRIYRAPGFSIKAENTWAFEELVEQGIDIDCSVFPAKRAHGGFESYGYSKPSIIKMGDISLKELPMNFFEFNSKKIVFSGGGYFRLLPYWMIEKMMLQTDYVMTYFHPHDFDKDKPTIDELSILRKFKSKIGAGSAFEKLERLITDFDFIDINEADISIDWEDTKIIKL